jgi:hypothetical protein
MVTRRTRILLGVVLLVVAMINIVMGLWIGDRSRLGHIFEIVPVRGSDRFAD